jgi:hypothetical protein
LNSVIKNDLRKIKLFERSQMKKFFMTRRGFLVGATAGGATLIASSYIKPDAWAAQEKSPLESGAKIKDSESASHGEDSSTFSVVDTYSFPGFKVVQITLPVLSIYTYLLISEEKLYS